MLSKKYRATTSQVQKALSEGKTRHARFLSLRFIPTQKESAATVVVSKKVAKNAVSRNTLKRRVKAVLRATSLPKETILIFYAKKGIEDLSANDIQKEIQTLLS